MAAAVAAAFGGSALAQGTPLQEAVTLLRLNKKAEAMEKMREILAADPSNAEALAMYRSVSQDEWYLLMTQRDEKGEPSDLAKIAQSLLERAKVETKERSRDQAAIAALVATATAADSDYPTRQAAVNRLINDHGEFAVPLLLEKLGSRDDVEGQVQAISALQQLRTAAVLPLIEALKSSNDVAVQNAAAALYHIGDARALPAMVQLANDDRVPVRDIARKFVQRHGGAGAGNPVDLLLAEARRYLKGNIPVGAFSPVVWTLRDDKLVATDVAALLYPAELAKACAADAVRLAPSSVEARSVLAQAYIAQASLIETAAADGDEAAKALEPVVAELKIGAMATGLDAVRAALETGVRDGLSPVALGATRTLAQVETPDSVDQSALLAALQGSNKAVRYEAAFALVHAANGTQVPQAAAVVAVLAEAVTEEGVRQVHVIAPAPESRVAVEAVNRLRGYAVESSVDAVSGMRSLLINPAVDVVVIHEILPDRVPEDVIGNVRKDARMANAKIVVIARDEEQAKARFGDSVHVVAAPLTGESLVAAVNTALEGVTNPNSERAEGWAGKAASALRALAAGRGNIGPAVRNLAQQLNRGDHVAVPAALALGFAGGAGELQDLMAALADSPSVEVKKAAAEACGDILQRLGSCPEAVLSGLVAALDAATDVELRLAIGGALCKARLPAQKHGELLQKLARIAAVPAQEG
jgi:HEAT repeat protein